MTRIKYFWCSCFFSNSHWRFTEQQEREETILYSSLPLLLTHEHSDIYLQLWMWDDYYVFLSTPHVTTRQLLNKIYHIIFKIISNHHFIDWWWDFNFFLFTWWFGCRFLLHLFDTRNPWTWNRMIWSRTRQLHNQVNRSPLILI